MAVVTRGSDLSQIETRWSLVLQAHQDQGDAAKAAQRELMERYVGAVHRYLLVVAQDVETAADLAQEFALRLLRGDFHRADPSRGRFRDYVKTSVRNLLADAHRRQKVRPSPLHDDGVDLPAPTLDPIKLDQQFLNCWRDDLLSRAWQRLADHERLTGQPFHTVLRYRAEFPTQRSHEIAAHLGDRLGKTLSAGWVRQNLRRARIRFVELLKDEVACSLGDSTEEQRIEELQTLGLWEYCRDKRPSRADEG
jgi:RNA polymerase sigma factor (sigma-70 family)